jgi:hypothetical protein
VDPHFLLRRRPFNSTREFEGTKNWGKKRLTKPQAPKLMSKYKNFDETITDKNVAHPCRYFFRRFRLLLFNGAIETKDKSPL